MKITYKQSICTCCGKLSMFEVADCKYNEKLNNLKNYNLYKQVHVSMCPLCNSILGASKDGLLYQGICESAKYKEVFNYSYLNGLNIELGQEVTEEVPANMYEAYAIVLKEKKDYETMLKTLFYVVYLKQQIINRYYLLKQEYGNEEGNADLFNILDGLLKVSINNNLNEIVNVFEFLTKKSIFITLIAVESYVKLGKKNKARALYHSIKDDLEEDLNIYILNVLS